MSNPASTTYLEGLGLSLPVSGAADYEKDYDQNYKVLDFIGAGKRNSVLSGIAVTAGSGLTVNWTAGTARIGSTDHAVGASSGSATDNTSYSNLKLANFVYVNSVGSVVIGTTVPTGEYAALAVVYTNAGAITKVVDARNSTILVLGSDGKVQLAHIPSPLTGKVIDLSVNNHDHSSAAQGGAIYAPVFHAYRNTDYAFSVASWTTIPLNTEAFDTAGFFNVGTYTFLPTVAGYYHLSAGAHVFYPTPNGTPALELAIRKNGTGVVHDVAPLNNYTEMKASASVLLYLNGTTDSATVAVLATGVTSPVMKTGGLNFFDGHKVG